MTDLQVKMAEHLERERTNRANEAIKEREMTAKYGMDYIPYDNTAGWSDIWGKMSHPGEGMSDSAKFWTPIGRVVKKGWEYIGNNAGSIIKALG
jgi:hypothetical protein